MNPVAIAKYLKISSDTVRLWIKRYEETGAVDDLPGRGRHRATTKQQDAQILKLADGEEPISATEIALAMAKKGTF